ncbi:hypothetical protein [Bradyrhizobium sp. B117]|uniref:hypothetical protein n=1 Tax=Bradyrhizobium sp. B117 TaxID=3140246 RepID=UPI003182CCFD
MIIECLDGDTVRLTEPFDFCRFKLILHAEARPETQRWNGITLLDDRDALVSIDLIPTLPGRPDDANWDQCYAEMVTKAREHGWIDTERHAIRAHVKRIP